MSRPTFSSLERAEACPASHALPRVLKTSEYAEVGKQMHDFLRIVTDAPAGPEERANARLRALERIPEPDTRKRCAAINFDEAFRYLEDMRAEAAFAIDVETRAVRLIGYDVGRQYGELGENEIPGALDLVAKHTVARVPVVNDWKSGFGEVAPPDENMQIGSHASALAEHFRSDAVIGRISFIDLDGTITPSEHAFNAISIETVFQRMRATLRRVREAEAKFAAGEQLTVNAGSWCTYCPARPHCPAMVNFARAMLSELENDKLGFEMLTPEQQGEAWTRAKLAEKMADEILKGLRAIAETDPIPLPNGKEVRATFSSRTSINGKRALEMLQQKGLTEHELLEVMITTRFPQFRAMKRRER